MKRKIIASFFVATVIAISLAGSFEINANTAAKGHLLYDTIDFVWLCVGSPTNCSF